jgi:hypothetical protein
VSHQNTGSHFLPKRKPGFWRMMLWHKKIPRVSLSQEKSTDFGG